MEYTSANEISIIEEVKAKEIKPKTTTSPSNDKLLPPKIKSPRTKGAKFLPNGRNKCYNKNGEIWQDGLFKNGRLWEGRVFQYDSEGIVTKVKIYKEDYDSEINKSKTLTGFFSRDRPIRKSNYSLNSIRESTEELKSLLSNSQIIEWITHDLYI